MKKTWVLIKKPIGSVWRYVVRDGEGYYISSADSICVAVLSALNLAKLAGLSVEIVDGGEELSDDK